MASERIQLSEEELEDVVGGAFNFYYNDDGAYACYVDGIGRFQCNSRARDRYTALKLQHKKDRWTAQQYIDALVSEGLFWN